MEKSRVNLNPSAVDGEQSLLTLMDVLLSSVSVSVSSKCPSSATFWSTIQKVPISLQENTNREGRNVNINQYMDFCFIPWYPLLPNCSPVLHLIESLSHCLYLFFYTNKIWQIVFSSHQKQLLLSAFYFSHCGGECVTLSRDNSCLYRTHLKTIQMYIKFHKNKFLFISWLEWLLFMSWP